MFPQFLFNAIADLRYLRGYRDKRYQSLLRDYLRRHVVWKEKDYLSGLYANPKVGKNNIVWIMWSQGLERAPKLVQKCVASVREQAEASGRHFILLTKDNLSQYVKLPNHIEDLYGGGKMTEAHYSDFVRTYLLIQYGGIWCDATCYWYSPLPSYVDNSPFFMFNVSLLSNAKHNPILCSNWFIKSESGNIILKKTFNMLCEYFRHHSHPLNYYIFHITLSLLARVDDECSNVWNSKPYICNMNPHILQFSFARTYKREEYEHLLGQCFIHKLSYKFEQELLTCETENVLQHFFCYH